MRETRTFFRSLWISVKTEKKPRRYKCFLLASVPVYWYEAFSWVSAVPRTSTPHHVKSAPHHAKSAPHRVKSAPHRTSYAQIRTKSAPTRTVPHQQDLVENAILCSLDTNYLWSIGGARLEKKGGKIWLAISMFPFFGPWNRLWHTNYIDSSVYYRFISVPMLSSIDMFQNIETDGCVYPESLFSI